MFEWRFDQGRLDYFQFDEIKRMARALTTINGISKPDIQRDLLREALSRYSSRPFAPLNYTVWRNYKRVFGCLLLATEVEGKIVCTDLCHILSKDYDIIDVDDYLGHFSNNFYYPSPVFTGYDQVTPQTFPVIAIIKLLLSEYLVNGKTCLSINEIGNYLIANEVTGTEPLVYFSTLKPKSFQGDLRQTRELVKFISQFSFLKWGKSSLFLEINSKEEANQIDNLFIPRSSLRSLYPETEILNLGSHFSSTAWSDLTIGQLSLIDAEFTEGSKSRVTHLRTERSKKLKDFYFAHSRNPHVCDMCTMDTEKQYPWADRLIELHHLLPLCSPVRVDEKATSTKDIVGICPSCHRATHKFYSKWLKDNGLKDFQSHEEAKYVYTKAKQEIVLT